MSNPVGDRKRDPGFRNPEWLRARGSDVCTALEQSGVFDPYFKSKVRLVRDSIRSFDSAASQGAPFGASPGWERFRRAIAQDESDPDPKPKYQAWMVALIDTAIDGAPVTALMTCNRYEYILMRNSVAIVLGLPEIGLPPKPASFEPPPFTGKPPRLTPIPHRAQPGLTEESELPEVMESIEKDPEDPVVVKCEHDSPQRVAYPGPFLHESRATGSTQPRHIHYPQNRDHLINTSLSNLTDNQSRSTSQSDRLTDCESLLSELPARRHSDVVEDAMRILLNEARANRERHEMLVSRIQEQYATLKRYESLLRDSGHLPRSPPERAPPNPVHQQSTETANDGEPDVMEKNGLAFNWRTGNWNGRNC